MGSDIVFVFYMHIPFQGHLPRSRSSIAFTFLKENGGFGCIRLTKHPVILGSLKI